VPPRANTASRAWRGHGRLLPDNDQQLIRVERQLADVPACSTTAPSASRSPYLVIVVVRRVRRLLGVGTAHALFPVVIMTDQHYEPHPSWTRP
jgi:hypothetical protein